MRPTCALALLAHPINSKTNSCAANNCAAFKPMIDPDTNPTQDTEHHLREPKTLTHDNVRLELTLPDGEKVELQPTPVEMLADVLPPHLTHAAGPLLTKVLPAGGPLLGGAWTCPVCGTTWPSGKPELCHDVPAAAGCPVER